MNPKPFGSARNPKNPDPPPSKSHDMWIALGSILAVVVMILIVLTFVGAGTTDGALFNP